MKLLGLNFADLEYTTLGTRFVSQPPAAIINNLLPYIFSISGIVLLIYLIAAGYQYMTSQGEPAKVAAARGKITYGIIGIIIVFGAYFIVLILAQFLGLDIVRFFYFIP